MGSQARSETDSVLRRRMHILERAHSDLSSGHSARAEIHSAGDSNDEQDVSLTEMEYETPSETSDDAPTSTSPPSSPKASRPRFEVPDEEEKDPHVSGRAWYQLDFAVVAALVSPVGNLLTGGDVIKNLLYILLLLFYLHQIVEAPWNLYQKSRARRRLPHLPPDSSPVEAMYRQKAETELHRLEMFFLFLTILSPFAGASLLRYILTAVAGKDVLTWFSTGIFVLATGVRPWTHALDRLTQRVDSLHDVIHHTTPDQTASNLREQVVILQNQIRTLEREIVKLREGTDDVYAYTDDAVDVVEKNLRRHEKRYERQDQRLRDLEVTMEALKGKVKRMPLHVDTTKSIFEYLFSSRRTKYPPSSSASPKYSLHSFTSSSDHLATIPEDAPLPGLSDASSFIDKIPLATIPLRVIAQVTSLATFPLRVIVAVLAPRSS